MRKIKLTRSQYEKLLIHEQQVRLKELEVIGSVYIPSKENLQEGWKDVVLGISMLIGIGLTGQNEIIAQNAVKNAETMGQVKSTLEDPEKVKELVDALKEKGMKDPSATLSTNAEKIIDTFNKLSNDNKLKYKVDVKAVNNLLGLNSKLKQGYALSKSDVSTDTLDTDVPKPISIEDTIDIEFGSSNLFVSGGFTLSPEGIDTIEIAIQEIKKQNGKIVSVEIETSTDTEEISKFKSESDPTGNIKLAELRTTSIANLISSLESNISITHREIPNNGSNIVSANQFLKAINNPEAIQALRDKTAEFRYEKVKIIAVFESPKTDIVTPPPQLIKKYRFELVKIIESSGKTRNIKTKVHFKHKKFKCKKGEVKAKIIECATF